MNGFSMSIGEEGMRLTVYYILGLFGSLLTITLSLMSSVFMTLSLVRGFAVAVSAIRLVCGGARARTSAMLANSVRNFTPLHLRVDIHTIANDIPIRKGKYYRCYVLCNAFQS